jgi:hypothetical protein
VVDDLKLGEDELEDVAPLGVEVTSSVQLEADVVGDADVVHRRRHCSEGPLKRRGEA